MHTQTVYVSVYSKPMPEMFGLGSRNFLSQLSYGGKLWRVQTLAKWQEKHHWQNKLDDESLIKHILKQSEDTFAPNLSIRAHVCTYL